MKGIILAGGTGSRLAPLTQAFCKQLLPIYDKPMVFYPLSVLMLAGIREILIITNGKDKDLISSLLGDGSDYGIRLGYAVQKSPDGIAQSFIIGKEFIGKENVSLILGDNIFYGEFLNILHEASTLTKGARIFTNYVDNPSEFAVAEFNESGKVISIEEKPKNPKSNHAVTGLYFYDNNVVKIAENLSPSKRGELEITDLNIEYLKKGLLQATELGRGFAWLDTGTQKALLEAGEFVHTIEKRQGLKIACLEEIAFNFGWINKRTLLNQQRKYINSSYGDYLKKLVLQ
jgi:glucose-1-phosphate thymidylyltransferase